MKLSSQFNYSKPTFYEHPFGMLMLERSYSSAAYKYGFNGKEKDNEINVDGGDYNFGARIYDGRLGRFLSVDPEIKKYPYFTSYLFAGNIPTRLIDFQGEGPGDILIVFPGGNLCPVLFTPSQPSVDNIFDKTEKNAGTSIKQTVIYPMTDQEIIDVMVKAIVDNKKINPDSKVVLYGYSYGGVIALKVSRELEKKGIMVDLLVTVDVANGNQSDKVDRNIPNNVKKNVNYYQTNDPNDDFEGNVKEVIINSKGGPTFLRGDNEGNTSVENHDLSEATYDGKPMDHHSVDDASQDDVISIINEELEPK